MRAAIYARYSSENQSAKSIDDQIRVCKNYIKENAMTIDEKDIYVDQAVSGSLVARPGIQALERAAEAKEFGAVVVDDLSRLSRSNHQMLTLVLKFNYYQVNIISVSDGIVANDENSKLGIQIRGLVNEIYLDDLKKKTMRGLEGQKLRGYSAGENVYGYRSKPVGELRLNKRGQTKYEGMVHYIYPEEAAVVKKIYEMFAGGKSINKIASCLNEEKIPTKKGLPGGWNTVTLSRILKNKKYTGQWDWRLSKNVRDPMTGKCKQIPRTKAEQLSFYREDLAIIDKELWNKTQERWASLKGTWPVGKKGKKFYQQKSYIHTSPTHLLSGLMKCHVCQGAIVLISGKGSGYYGCYNSRRKTCKNMLTISVKKVESAIMAELKEKIVTIENLEYVYQRVEQEAAKTLEHAPDLIRTKKAQLEKLQSHIRNYLEFIKQGNLSKAVAEALSEAESKSEELNQEMGTLESHTQNRFKPPPKEWIQFRLERLHETLNKNTAASAMALKELLGAIRMEPVLDKDSDPLYGLEAVRNDTPFKPYYVAHTKIQTLALLDEGSKGSNWLQTRPQRDLNPC